MTCGYAIRSGMALRAEINALANNRILNTILNIIVILVHTVTYCVTINFNFNFCSTTTSETVEFDTLGFYTLMLNKSVNRFL